MATYFNNDILIDEEMPIVINTLTRECVFGRKFNKQIASKNDVDSNQITFRCDRYIEGYDVFSVDSTFITWTNKASKFSRPDLIINKKIDETDPNFFLFSWTVPKEATDTVGEIEFFISFIEYADVGRTVISYQWSTKPRGGLFISDNTANKVVDNALTVSEIMEHAEEAEPVIVPDLTDREGAIEFNMFNRTFKIYNNLNKQIAVAGDCCSNIVTFNITRGFCDYDAKRANLILVKWERGKEHDFSILTKKTATIDKVVCSWLLDPKLTKEAGEVSFSLCFITTREDGYIIQKWNSDPCEMLYVGEGMYNAEVDDVDRIDVSRFGMIEQEQLTEMIEEVFSV